AEPGFETHRIYLLSADFGDDPVKAAASYHQIVERLASLPELSSVATGTAPMMGTSTRPIVVKKSNAAEGAEHGRTLTSSASETYLHTLGISLLRGRDFTRQEASTGAHVSVISEST